MTPRLRRRWSLDVEGELDEAENKWQRAIVEENLDEITRDILIRVVISKCRPYLAKNRAQAEELKLLNKKAWLKFANELIVQMIYSMRTILSQMKMKKPYKSDHQNQIDQLVMMLSEDINNNDNNKDIKSSSNQNIILEVKSFIYKSFPRYRDTHYCPKWIERREQLENEKLTTKMQNISIKNKSRIVKSSS
ncbi:uncharacterized protein L201_002064 [Kwoniella dendrophila CBS 6074]|uniref:Uncharacterized protein n=1 Tax=Kwoniella dendrophila CBS 6074 TaxID=1295534 RepID=A0AAX4JRS6_9TREE